MKLLHSFRLLSSSYAGTQQHPQSTPTGCDMTRLPTRRLLALALAAGLSLPAAAALAAEPFILFPRSFGSSLYDEILAACRASGVTLRITQEAPQMSSIVNLVAAELGVSVVPASTAQLQLPGVRYLDIEGQMPLARLALAVSPGALENAPLVRHLWTLAELI